MLSRWSFALVILLAGVSACGTPDLSREEVVAAYTEALQHGDRDRLLELNNPAFDQVSEIDQKITAIGNRTWINPQTTWLANPVTGENDAARITATTTTGTPITDRVTLTRIDDTWYVNLGTRTPQPGDPIPAETTRPSPS